MLTIVASLASMLVAAPPASASTAELRVVLTAVPGEDAACPPSFADGTRGMGPVVAAEWGETVTLCASVINVGVRPAVAPVLQLAANGTTTTFGADELGTSIPAGVEVAIRHEVVVNIFTPRTATATITGDTPLGRALAPDSDVAGISARIPAKLILPPWLIALR